MSTSAKKYNPKRRTTKPSQIVFDPNYRSKFLKLTEVQQYRGLEMIPGILVWLTFILCIVFSFTHPLWAIYFIIIFDLYWLIRISYLMLHLLISWRVFLQNKKTNWLQKLQMDIPEYQEYIHILFYPTAGEPFEVIDESFTNLTKANYPTEKIIVVLAGEERDKIKFEQYATQIKNKYEQYFHTIFITIHPKDTPGDMVGKGSNLHYAGKEVKKYIDSIGHDYDKIIVSSFDIDTLPHEQYFPYLTYTFATTPNATRASYQPIAVYNNNIWESHFLIRLVMNSTTFWLLTDLARPERLFTFSSHAMSWRMLTDVGFWQRDIVTEDSRIFLQGFCQYHGDYRVVPLYIPVYMNTVWTGNFWQGMKAQYKQMRRWAWGVENFPYQAWFYLKVKNLPIKKGLHYLWNQLEGVYSWATAPILITIMGRLPLWVISDSEKSTVIVQNAPFVLETLMNIGMIGLIISAAISTALMPPRPGTIPRWKWLIIPLQWILFPVVMILFGSIPATDSLTRLMTGKYLGFNITPKGKGHRVIAGNE